MSTPPVPRASVRIALLGFSEFERSALASCFRLAAQREPRFELVVTLTDADYLVADADHGPSVQLVEVTERLAVTVCIGLHAPEGAAVSMRRPIDALQVMKALAALVQARGGGLPTSMPTPTPVPARPAVRPVARSGDAPLPPVVPERGVIVQSMLRMPPPSGLAEPVPELAPELAPEPGPVAPAAPPMFVGPPAPPRALVVDDSDIARRFLTGRLLPWGLRSDTASTSAQVIELLAQRSYEVIFLDVELGPDSEMDGLALSCLIKRSALAISASVIVVSAHNSEVDRARGSLAGCDGYLGKPIKEAELAMLLRRQGLRPPEGLAALAAPTAAPAAVAAVAAVVAAAAPTAAPTPAPTAAAAAAPPEVAAPRPKASPA